MDSFDLTRPKKNISRDFSDGQLVAEIVYHYLPKVVNLHNFSKANSAKNKQKNWDVLKHKVFPKMAFSISNSEIKEIITCQKMSIENFLSTLRAKLENTEKVDLFATANQPLKEKKEKTLVKKERPRMATFSSLEELEEEGDPAARELNEVMELKTKIEDLHERMIILRKTLR